MKKIALIGRPNVGKSTLFNRLIRSQRAITHDRPGITRDRMEGTVRRQGENSFAIIDTGGITLESIKGDDANLAEGPEGIRGFEAEILRHAQAAIDEAAAVVLVVDGIDGLTPFDESLAKFVRRANKPILLLVNKVDGPELEAGRTADFYPLGFDILAVSAAHGFNLLALDEALFDLIRNDGEEEGDPALDSSLQSEQPGQPERTGETGVKDTAHFKGDLRLAMLGRPNAGKSSIVNALVGEDRMIVSDVPGTTRDSVDVLVEIAEGKGAGKYVFVDTAGIRRRTKITDSVEVFSVNSAIKSSTKADVTLLVIDAQGGLAVQDKRLLDLLDERKTPFMVLVNKMDLLKGKDGEQAKRDIKDALAFSSHVPVLYVSAKTGKGLDGILPLARSIFAECSVRVPTGQLNRAMQAVLDRKQPPVVKRVRPKFFYLTQAETAPPTFVFFVSDADRIKEPYARYLEKSLRKLFSIKHAPIRVHFRSSHKKKDEQ